MSCDDRRAASLKARRLMVWIYYQSPWNRAALYLSGIRKGRIVREPDPGSVRDRLADWCDHRDRAWREKWALRWPDRKPPAWWKGRSSLGPVDRRDDPGVGTVGRP